MRAKKLNGFSLMEMMVVLLIVAIIAAASAPMVTKKLSRSAGTNDSPWVFTGLNNSIAYNMSGNDNSTVIIGSTTTPANMQGSTRLYIDSGNNASHIAFGNGNTVPLLLTADPTRGRIGFSNQNLPDNSVAFGINQNISNNSTNIIAIGSNTTNGSLGAALASSGTIAIGDLAHAFGNGAICIGQGNNNNLNANMTGAVGIGTIAIGQEARAANTRAIALGGFAKAEGLESIAIGNSDSDNTIAEENNSIAIGSEAHAGNQNAIAIGNSANADKFDAIAIGTEATATHSRAVALGYNAEATADNQIVLGDENATVYIQGNLVVDGNVVLANHERRSRVIVYAPHNNKYATLNSAEGGKDGECWTKGFSIGSININGKQYTYYSDRRLKNVGEKYTAGLAELKKLDFFHFTFKEDKEKTQHVGVMAQDLQKVFPDAVTKGEDGYLRIRLEDMFYAVINAVKELDNKITEIVQNITDINSTIEKQSKTIEEQQKTIDKIQKTMEEQQKVIEKLEKQIKKLD